jgi:hypothetical protein
MALMMLTRLPRPHELKKIGIDFNGFHKTFIDNHVAPFIARVEVKDGVIHLGEYTLPMCNWFRIIEN